MRKKSIIKGIKPQGLSAEKGGIRSTCNFKGVLLTSQN